MIESETVSTYGNNGCSLSPLIKRLILAILILSMAGCTRHHHTPSETHVKSSATPRETNSYYYFTEAQLYRKQGETDTAIDYLKKAISKDPNSIFLKKELAVLYLQAKDNQSALSVVESILNTSPDNINALIMYGRIQQELGQSKLAVDAYSNVLELDPKQQRIYSLLGSLLQDEGDYEEAKSVYEKLVLHFPSSAMGHYLLGSVLAKLNMESEAEKEFNEASRLKPDWDDPLFGLVELLKSKMESSPAPDYTEDIIDRYKRILTQHPNNIRAQMDLGLFYHQQEMAAEAAAVFDSLGRRSQQEFEVIVNVIQLYLTPGRYADAIVVVNGLLRSAPNNDNLHYLLGAAYYGQKKTEPAILHFKKVSAQSRFFPEAVAHISYIYQEAAELEKGIAFLTEVIQTVPDNAEFYYYLAALHEEDKSYALAVDALKRGIDIEPKNAKLLFRLGVVYDKWSRKNDSMEMMKRVIAVDPKHANALNYLGYTYADQGRNLDEAERLIKLALKYKPGDGYITDSLGWVYYKKGLYQKALELLEKAVELVPNDSIILEHLGDAYLKTNNKEKAIQVYQRSLQQRKEDRGGLDEKIQKLRQEGY